MCPDIRMNPYTIVRDRKPQLPSTVTCQVKQRLEKLPPYEKMIEYYKAMLFYGEYQVLKPEFLSAPLFMLDNVNYSSLVAEDPLPIRELLSLIDIEPGYGTVTGDCEVGP